MILMNDCVSDCIYFWCISEYGRKIVEWSHYGTIQTTKVSEDYIKQIRATSLDE